jgi:hypothetical protein
VRRPIYDHHDNIDEMYNRSNLHKSGRMRQIEGRFALAIRWQCEQKAEGTASQIRMVASSSECGDSRVPGLMQGLACPHAAFLVSRKRTSRCRAQWGAR